VASSTGTASELLASLLAVHGGEPIYWDVLPDNTACVELARQYGFAPRRRLARMTYGRDRERFSCRNDLTYAIAGFEYG
jgi:Acetyltransferase (GNAT) domain